MKPWKPIMAAAAIAFGSVFIAAARYARRISPQPQPVRASTERTDNRALDALRAEDKPEEQAERTLPLELGEGDARRGSMLVRDVENFGSIAVPIGTRVEKLKTDYATPDGMYRIRIIDGKFSGAVGHAWAYQIQAAR